MKNKVNIILIFLVFLLMNSYIVTAGIFVSDELTHKYISTFSEEIEGTILIKNNEQEPNEAIIYQTDYLYNAEGENIFERPGTLPRSNAKWIDVSPRHIVVPANGEAYINYKIFVPQDTSLRGTYWSVIMVEPVNKSSQDNDTKDGDVKIGLNIKTRYGIRVINSMEGAGEYDLNILNRQIVKNDEGKFFTLDLENSGEFMINPEVWMEVYNRDGELIDKFISPKKTIFPETSVRHYLNIEQLLEGEYRALVVIDNEDENIWGAYYNFEI